MKVLITGGAGFIGTNYIYYLLGNGQDEIINLDLLSYAGNLSNLARVKNNSRYRFIKGDICDRGLVERIVREGVEAIINFAAESHVDRSIEDPNIFIRTNVQGTQVLLDLAAQYRVQKFVQISTDEVYGSLGGEGYFTEESPLSPNSPYSASKASADLLVRAYHQTYGLCTNVTRCSNNYGPYQFPEKLIPLFIINALCDQAMPVYGDGQNIRDWIHVSDHCRAIDLVLRKGESGRVYNIGGGMEKTNLEITREILRELNKPWSLVKFVADRPGHDRRYAIDYTRIKQELGWQPGVDFKKGLKETINWYQCNKAWWKQLNPKD
ncbi:MAG: dTDP-glucose 4,6-dehydratase [Halanaerobiales bacterium]|nr:dTDP-glucose 4,6-dehydratase [Halanaerobiales bacterium]